MLSTMLSTVLSTRFTMVLSLVELARWTITVWPHHVRLRPPFSLIVFVVHLSFHWDGSAFHELGTLTTLIGNEKSKDGCYHRDVKHTLTAIDEQGCQ
jgi:hypothetical protein